MYRLTMTDKTLSAYLKRLPIGYYLKYNIPVKVSPNNNSYIDLKENIIYISSNFLSGIELDHEPNDYEIENIIRNTLYHEVSHAILTPMNLIEHCTVPLIKHLVNVFEDERIETVLKTFYKRVDFKKFIKMVNNYNEDTYMQPTRSAKELFYSVVRFDQVPYDIASYNELWAKEILKEKNNILKKYGNPFTNKDKLKERMKFITAFSHVKDAIDAYINDIRGLYYSCQSIFTKAKKEQEALANSNAGFNVSKQEDNTSSDQNKEKKNENNDQEEKKEEVKEEDKLIVIRNPFEETTEEEEQNTVSIFEEENEEIEIGSEIMGGDNQDAFNNKVREVITNFLEQQSKIFKNDFYLKARRIIKSYVAKNKNNEGSTATYSGKLNPRLFIRDLNTSYKWFDKSVGNQLKKGSKLHLNIFCDTSGSFAPNQNIVNGMLCALEKIEKELHTIFEFDVFEIDWTMRKLPREQRRINVGNCGTSFSREWQKIFVKAQDTVNDTLNIVLFDGNIFPAKYSKQMLGKYIRFFNKNNVILILEESNAPTFRRVCKQCRKLISVPGDRFYDYPKKLEENILSVLNSYVQGI